MGCNCGGGFQPDDGLEPADNPNPAYDANYTSPPTVIPPPAAAAGAKKWNPDTGRTED